MKYYIDTSVWLNLFKREGDPTKGKPYWKIAKEFIEKIMFSDANEIIYSGIILRELQIKLGEQAYCEKREFFVQEQKFIKVDVLNEDKVMARQLESKYNFNISFYDLVHLSIAKRLGLILVTRDTQLIRVAQENNVIAGRPEEL